MKFSALAAGGSDAAQLARVGLAAGRGMTSSVRGFRPTRTTTPIIAAAAIGLALRVTVWRSTLGALDGDEAAWGLIVRHVLHGEVPAFFWNQPYGGTIEPLLTVPLFALFGSRLVVLRLVPALLGAVAALLVWRVGRRIFSESQARAAACLFWLWPFYNVWKSTRAHGFYGAGLVLALLTMLMVLRLDASTPRRLDASWLGLVLGLSIWESPQIVTYAVPALIWLLVRRPRIVRHAPLAVLAAAVGALPWLLSNLRHGWWSLHQDDVQGTYLTRLHGFVSGTFPMELGMRSPWTSEWLGGAALGVASTLVLYVALVHAAARLWRGSGGILAAVLVGYPFLYAASGATWYLVEPRYVYLLSPVVALLLASLLDGGALLAAGALAAVLTVVGTLVVLHSSAYARTDAGLLADRPLGPVIAVLERRHVTAVYAPYWVAYPLTFDTSERIVAAEIGAPRFRRIGRKVTATVSADIRYPRYGREVAAAARPGFVAPVGSLTAESFPVGMLERAGYSRVETGGYVIWLPRRS